MVLGEGALCIFSYFDTVPYTGILYFDQAMKIFEKFRNLRAGSQYELREYLFYSSLDSGLPLGRLLRLLEVNIRSEEFYDFINFLIPLDHFSVVLEIQSQTLFLDMLCRVNINLLVLGCSVKLFVGFHIAISLQEILKRKMRKFLSPLLTSTHLI